MRTPTKHSTNVDTAVPVVPVPPVVNRTPIASTSSEPNASSKNSSVRLLLNSSPDSLMPVSQQFTLFSSARLQMNDQPADRPILINSSVTSNKKSDIDAKSATGESNATHFNPIIINQPKPTPQIMPLVQNTDIKSFNRVGPSLSTIIPNTNSNARLVSIDASNHPSPNLLTSLRPNKRDTTSSLPTIQVCTSGNQPVSDTVTTANSSTGSSFLRASSLVSHSTVPSTESNQTPSLISVVPVDPSRSNLQPSVAASTIRPAQRYPITVSSNRPTATGFLINRPATISRHPVITSVPTLNSLNPIRKRSRKQQLLAPQGTETSPSPVQSGQKVVSYIEMSSTTPTSDRPKSLSTSTTSSTSTIEAALHGANSLSTLNVANSSNLMNVRVLPYRSGPANKEASSGSHFEQVSTPSSSQFHSLVVSSSSVPSGNDEVSGIAQTTTTASSTVSPAASLVTASSFSSSSSSSIQPSMYVFPSSTAVQMPPLRPNTTLSATMNSVASISGSNSVPQIRFRPPSAVNRSPLTSAFTQQNVRPVLTPSMVNNPQPVVQPSTSALSKKVDLSTVGMKSAAQIITSTTRNADENSRKESTKSSSTPVLDQLAQSAVPVMRLSDPNSRNTVPTTSQQQQAQQQQQLKRPRKQSNAVGGIKKQCTWELLADPLDSSKSVWRSPHQQVPPSQTESRQVPPLHQPSTSRFVDSIEPSNSKVEGVDSNSAIRGVPRRMHLYKSKVEQDSVQRPGKVPSTSAGSGFVKGAKTSHFLRSNELKFRPLENGRPPASTVGRNEPSADVRGNRRLLRDAVGQISNESKDIQTLRAILETRSLQEEFKYLNNPVDTTSTLDLTCWRLRLCLNSCEVIMNEEIQRLESLSNALNEVSLQDQVESAPRPDVPRLICNSITDQNLITEMFLQAIPPASPAPVPLKDAAPNIVEDNDRKLSPMQIKPVEERTRALIQRVKVFTEGLQKIHDLSSDLVKGHAGFVQDFVEHVECVRRGGGSNPENSNSSPNVSHTSDGRGSNDDGGDDNISQDGEDLSPSPHPSTSKHLRSPPVSQKGSSPGRSNTYHNARRR